MKLTTTCPRCGITSSAAVTPALGLRVERVTLECQCPCGRRWKQICASGGKSTTRGERQRGAGPRALQPERLLAYRASTSDVPSMRAVRAPATPIAVHAADIDR